MINTEAMIKGTVQVSEHVKVNVKCVSNNEFHLTDQNDTLLKVFHNEEIGFYTTQKTNDMAEPIKIRLTNEEMINVLDLFRQNVLKEESLFPIEYDEDYEYDEDNDEVFRTSYHELEDEDDEDEGFY